VNIGILAQEDESGRGRNHPAYASTDGGPDSESLFWIVWCGALCSLFRFSPRSSSLDCWPPRIRADGLQYLDLRYRGRRGAGPGSRHRAIPRSEEASSIRASGWSRGDRGLVPSPCMLPRRPSQRGSPFRPSRRLAGGRVESAPGRYPNRPDAFCGSASNLTDLTGEAASLVVGLPVVLGLAWSGPESGPSWPERSSCHWFRTSSASGS